MYLKSLYNTQLQLNLNNTKINDNLNKELLYLLKKTYGNKCNDHGYIQQENINLIKRTIGKLIKW